MAKPLGTLLGICEKTDYPDFKTFVTDNGSTDGSIELVKSRYP